MHRLTFGLFVFLVGCGTVSTKGDGAFRAASSPIYSNAAFDLNRLEGRWDQVAAFANGAKSKCRSGGAEFVRKANAVDVRYGLCLSGQTVAGQGTVVAAGPGRFRVDGKDGLGQDWWVLWVDESYRTMAIGTPSGTFGFILNKGADLPADRLNAALEVFDFNGYATEKSVSFGR